MKFKHHFINLQFIINSNYQVLIVNLSQYSFNSTFDFHFIYFKNLLKLSFNLIKDFHGN